MLMGGRGPRGVWGNFKSSKRTGFELSGRWRTLAVDTLANRVQVLILRQLCSITVWLSIIGICQLIGVCSRVFS